MQIQRIEIRTIRNIFSNLIKKDTDEDQKDEIDGLGVFQSNYLKNHIIDLKKEKKSRVETKIQEEKEREQ